MSYYKIGDKVTIKRADKDKLELDVGGNKAIVHTEDLAALVREELPNDRAKCLFSEIEERAISKGKARVVVTARKDIKKGEEVCFTLDITKYVGNSQGIRTTPSGLLY